MNDFDTRLAIGAAYRRDPMETMHDFGAYQQMDRGNAARVDDFLRAHGRDQDASAALRRLVQSDEFAGCDEPTKAGLLDAALAHPDASAMLALRQLAGEPAFRALDDVRAGAEAEHLASGGRPSPRDALARSGMPAPRPSPMAWNQFLEMGLQGVHYVEAMAEASLPHLIARGVGLLAGPAAASAALPIAGGGLAGLGGAASIYGSIHAAEQAHDEGRAIGEAAAHGHGFTARLQEHASGSPATPRTGPEARGAAKADAYWNRLGPADRVALRSPEGGGTFFSELASAVLERAMGRGR